MPKRSGIPPEELLKRVQKIRYAEKVREDAAQKFGYNRAQSMLQGNFREVLPSFMLGIDMIPINLVYAYLKTFVPSVYSRDPYITVNPKGKQWIIGAKILEHANNATWRQLKLKRQVKRCIIDAIQAEGWIKLGYSSSLGSIKKNDDKAINPSEFMTEDEIFAQHIHWKMMIRDPDATDGIYDARFVAQKLILPLEAVKDSDLYENTEDLKPSHTMDMLLPDYQKVGHEFKVQKDYIVLWEEWDRDEECVYTYAENHDKYLMQKDWPYKFAKKGANQPYPFELLRFNESTNEPYAPNLIAAWEPQIWEKIKLRSLELDHVKRFGRQYIAERGALNEAETDKLTKGITGSVILKDKGAPDPTVIPYPQIQTDIYGVENRIDLDMDNISGQPSAVRAAPQKTQSRTVGEVKSMIAAFDSRQSEPQGIVEDFAEQISYKLIGLMQQYFRGEKFLKVTQLDRDWLADQIKLGLAKAPNDQDLNDMAQRLDTTGFLMKAKDIKDIQYDIECRAGSALPLDKKNRMQSMIEQIQLGEKIGAQPGGLLSKVIGKNLFAEWDMPEIQAAYDKEIQMLDAQIKTGLAAQQAQASLQKHRVDQMKQRAAGLQQGPQPPPQKSPIPSGLLS